MHRMSIGAALLACVTSAHAQQLLSIEIVGPAEVMEQTETQYQCIAHFDTGNQVVTAAAAWTLAPTLPVSVDGGVLSVGDFARPVVLKLSAEYASDSQTATSSLEVTVATFGATQVAKLLAQDAQPNQKLGTFVRVSGDLAVVAASDPGAAYVFDAKTGEQIAKLDYSGYILSLAFGGTTIAVSRGFGPVLLFDALTGRQIGAIPPPPGSYGFPSYVAISRSLLVVSGASDSCNSGTEYVFDITTGEPVSKLKLGGYDLVDIDANLVIANEAIWFYFHRPALFDALTGEVIKYVFPSMMDVGSNLHRVAISGARVVIGQGLNTAHLLDVETGRQIAKLTPGGLIGGYGFAISGPVTALGTSLGSVYLFDSLYGDQFGALQLDNGGVTGCCAAVAIDGDTLVVGARLDDDVGLNAGAAYVLSVQRYCPRDMNGDGEVNVLDLVTFGESWRAGITAADCDGNGLFEPLDFDCFHLALIEGCD